MAVVHRASGGKEVKTSAHPLRKRASALGSAPFVLGAPPGFPAGLCGFVFGQGRRVKAAPHPLVAVAQPNRHTSGALAELEQACVPVDFGQAPGLFPGHFFIEAHATGVVAHDNVAAPANEGHGRFGLVVTPVSQHHVAGSQGVMAEAFAFLVGGDFHLAQAEAGQINRDVQAVRRGGRARLLHGGAVNGKEAQLAAAHCLG